MPNYTLPPGLRQHVGYGRVSPDARKPTGTSRGLAIENIERFHLGEAYVPDTDYTGLSSSAWTEVDPVNLAWTVWFSGARPITMKFTLLAKYVTGGGFTALTLLLNGESISTGVIGGWYLDTANTWVMATPDFVIKDPVPGTHRLSLGYKVATSGSLSISRAVPITVIATEE